MQDFHWEYKEKFYAAKDDDAERSEIYYDYYPGAYEGSTLEEAVAKLWLVLNK